MDKLEELYNGAEGASKVAASVAGIKNKEVRKAFANAITARCDAHSMVELISTISEETEPSVFKDCCKAWSLHNGSQLRQALEKGFEMPQAGKATAFNGESFC